MQIEHKTEKGKLTITSGLNGNDFIDDKKTYILQNGINKIFFRFGNNWNPNLFRKLLIFKFNKHFKPND